MEAAGNVEMEDSALNGSPERPSTSVVVVTTPEAAAKALDAQSPLFPTPLRNKIAKVAAKQTDPYFNQEVEGENGETMNLYKELGTFTRDVSIENVQKFITVLENGPCWTVLVSERTNYFRTLLLSICPPHFAPAFDQSFHLRFTEFKKDKRGRKRSNQLVIGMSGYCSSKTCPTTFVCGFTEESIKRLLADVLPTEIEFTAIIKNACYHVKGAAHGQLRGNERQKQIDEMNDSKMKPGEFAKLKLLSND